MTETTDRRLARIDTIRDVLPIEGADAIERAVVGGWNVVVKKGEFSPGDICVYFEIDSELPLADERFAFLAPRGSRTRGDGTEVHRLKTARLRGVYSQGLALPASEFIPELEDARFRGNDDVTEKLGITKYEPPLPTNMAVVGPFPSKLVRKTDSERVQNLTDAWPAIASTTGWVPTEKIDGTSVTIIKDRDGGVHVCSRNWELQEGDDMYWSIARDSGVIDWLHDDCAIQAEIFGEGVQGNPLGINGRKLAVFAWWDCGLPIPHGNGSPGWDRLVNDRCIVVPRYDLELPDTVEGAIEQANGIKSLVSPGRLAEGIVWHNGRLHDVIQEGSSAVLEALGGRNTLKAVSNRYIMKHDG